MKYGLALDIDETLSATGVTWAKELSEILGNPESLTPTEFVEKYPNLQDVPYWEKQKISELIQEKLYSNEYQMGLEVIEGAKEMVNKINQIIPIVAYITARPTTVLEGTKQWLVQHGFPEAHIITRPDNVSVDERSKWKAKVLHEMYPEVVGIVDDHHELAYCLPDEYKGVLFLFTHQTTSRGNIHIIPCKTWQDVHAAVTQCNFVTK